MTTINLFEENFTNDVPTFLMTLNTVKNPLINAHRLQSCMQFYLTSENKYMSQNLCIYSTFDLTSSFFIFGMLARVFRHIEDIWNPKTFHLSFFHPAATINAMWLLDLRCYYWLTVLEVQAILAPNNTLSHLRSHGTAHSCFAPMLWRESWVFANLHKVKPH